MNNKITIGIIALLMIIGVIVIVFPNTSQKSISESTGEHDEHEQSATALPAKPVMVDDIGRKADDIPAPLADVREENKRVVVDLTATQVVAEIDDGITYEYWTYNDQSPGPFIRVMEGDTVEVRLTHSHGHVAANESEHSFTVSPFVPMLLSRIVPPALAQSDHEHDPGTPDEHEHEMDTEGVHVMPDGSIMTGSGEVLEGAYVMPDGSVMLGNGEILEGVNLGEEEGMTAEEHAAAGHGEHSIDLHAVIGPGGGAEVIRTPPDETKAFQFKATRPGIYLYHCGSPHVATHIANGMYGLILVEPKEGLPPVDREFYVMQGELYTAGKFGEKGHQEFDKEKLLNESPAYFVFNGRVGALTGEGELKAKVGETIRIFFGNSGQVPSSFHIIGGIFDKLYAHGDIISPPRRNVQTTLVPAGSATMMEMKMEVPGKFLLVDHSLTRSLDKGALGILNVEGEEQPEIYKGVE